MSAETQVNSILAALQWDAPAGTLAYNGVRYLLIRPETLAQVQQSLEAQAGPVAAGELLYAGGFVGGQLSGQRYKQLFGLDAAGAVAFMCRMGGELGWGAFELRELDLAGGRLEVVVRQSAFAQAYHPQPGPYAVCHLIRGVLGGLLSGLLDAPVRTSEPACAAMCAAECHFSVEAQR